MKKYFPFLAILTIILPVIITDVIYSRDWDTKINADGYGYYAYLPCTFIYHHLDFERAITEEKKIHPDRSQEELSYIFEQTATKNQLIDKCFIGEAILLIPFFLLAYLLSYLLGFDLGGYSVLFQQSVVLGALFYLVIGLVFLRKLMLLYSIPDKIIYLSLLLILYATNLFHYSTFEPSMSHIYSFGLTSIFLFYCKISINKPLLKNLLLMTVAFTLLILIRPTNILSLFAIPFLAKSIPNLKVFIGNIFSTKRFPLLLLVAVGIFSIQLAIWHIETGKWFVWSYPGEGFVFSKPHILQVLFSYRKGWFIYTPFMFIIIIGSLYVFLKNGDIFRALSAFLFFLLIVYVCSCWQTWWYGGGFGMRPLIDYYPFFALLFAISVSTIQLNWIKWSFLTLSFLCLGLCIIQTIQYNKLIFSFDCMNKTRYWDRFLKTDSKYGWLYENPSSKLNLFAQPVLSSSCNKDTTKTPVSKFTLAASDLLRHQSSKGDEECIWIYAELWVYMKDYHYDASLILKDKSTDGKITDICIKNIQDDLGGTNEWDKIEWIEKLPALSQTDSLQIFIHTKNGKAYIDDVAFKFGTHK